jgi:hypothetical protein
LFIQLHIARIYEPDSDPVFLLLLCRIRIRLKKVRRLDPQTWHKSAIAHFSVIIFVKGVRDNRGDLKDEIERERRRRRSRSRERRPRSPDRERWVQRK